MCPADRYEAGLMRLGDEQFSDAISGVLPQLEGPAVKSGVVEIDALEEEFWSEVEGLTDSVSIDFD